jgi:hypothetical protein
VRVEGQMTVNGIDESISAALAGFGIAFALEERIFGRTTDIRSHRFIARDVQQIGATDLALSGCRTAHRNGYSVAPSGYSVAPIYFTRCATNRCD